MAQCIINHTILMETKIELLNLYVLKFWLTT